ncbi:hypothetical protein OROHE_009478 [Orobanche hederae]
MDWLNLTASEEMKSVKVEMTKIAEAFSTLPQDLKEAFAKFQHLEEQSLLEEQSKLHTVESQTVAVLEYTDSRISVHDAKIHAMTKVITSFEEQQDNVLKVLQSIDRTVSELNARKGEGQSDSSRDPAHSRPDQARRSEHESTRSSSSWPEHPP